MERHRGDDVELRTTEAPRAIVAVVVRRRWRRHRSIEADEGEPRRFAEAPGEHVLELVRQEHATGGIGGRGEGARLRRPEADARRAGGLGQPAALARRREIEHAPDRGDPVEEPEPVGLADGEGALVDEQEQAHRERADERQAEEREQLAAQRLRQEFHAARSSTSAARL